MAEIVDPVVSSDMVTALVAMAYDLFCNNKGDLRIFHKTVSRYN